MKALVSFALLVSSGVGGLGLSLVVSAPAAQPLTLPLPKCFGVVTEMAGQTVLVCQNPCLGGGSGCTHYTGMPEGQSFTSQTCICQGGEPDCCDVWYDPYNGVYVGGACNTPACPSAAGTCQGHEDPNGDISANCST
jgi:hypothetical protein